MQVIDILKDMYSKPLKETTGFKHCSSAARSVPNLMPPWRDAEECLDFSPMGCERVDVVVVATPTERAYVAEFDDIVYYELEYK